MNKNESRVELYPWDYHSSDHIERMYLQRLACGWRSEEVHEQWVRLCREGHKTLYWVVSVLEHEKSLLYVRVFADGTEPRCLWRT